jgi:hypothetical protein
LKIASRLFKYTRFSIATGDLIVPRSRNIKPGFFANGELAELPIPTRLLFIGLWTIADREGRLPDNPKQIKFGIFPSDLLNVDEALGQLAAAKFITRYKIKGDRYIEVTNFTKHQNPHRKEAPSTIPAPVKHRARTVQARLIPDSSFLKPESEELATQGGNAAKVMDSVKRRIWRDGVELLTQDGMTEKCARSLLGKLAKDYSNVCLAECIAVTQAKNPAEIESFLIKCLEEKKNGQHKLGISGTGEASQSVAEHIRADAEF